jgi:hypothetical protein
MKIEATPCTLYRFTTRLLIALACLLIANACTTPPPVATPPKKTIKKTAVPTLDDYSDGTRISNSHWKWVTTVQPHDNIRHLPQLDNYLLELKADGWFNVITPCFKGDGMYEVNNGRIALALLHSHPKKQCLHTETLTFFLKILEAGSSYREDAERLSLYDNRSKTTLIFLRQGE